MASSLTGRVKKLTWADFGTPVPKPAPTPGGFAIGAHTETAAPVNYGWASKGGVVSLADNVTVAIQFVASKSWVADWVFKEPKQFQDDLLKHEQGHYDITALMARDLFIDIMQLKAKTFASKKALDDAIQALGVTYNPQPVHKKYDAAGETNHSANDAQQKVWDGLIQKAWTTARTPAMSAPDGTPYKLRLLDVLKTAGKWP